MMRYATNTPRVEVSADFPSTTAPFMELVGPVSAGRDSHGHWLSVEIESRHVNGDGTAHGGLLATLADLAIGNEVARSSALPPGATISLTLDYVLAVHVGDVLCVRARVDRPGGRLGLGSAELRVGDEVVATARAWFAMRRPRP